MRARFSEVVGRGKDGFQVIKKSYCYQQSCEADVLYNNSDNTVKADQQKKDCCTVISILLYLLLYLLLSAGLSDCTETAPSFWGKKVNTVQFMILLKVK